MAAFLKRPEDDGVVLKVHALAWHLVQGYLRVNSLVEDIWLVLISWPDWDCGLF